MNKSYCSSSHTSKLRRSGWGPALAAVVLSGGLAVTFKLDVKVVFELPIELKETLVAEQVAEESGQ